MDDKGTLAVDEKGFWLTPRCGCEGQQLTYTTCMHPISLDSQQEKDKSERYC